MDRDGDWVLPAAILLILQHSAALAVSYHVNFSERPPTLSYMLMALALSSLAGLTLLLRQLWKFWLEDEDHPIRRLERTTSISAVATYFIGFQLVGLQFAALTWLKEMIPLAVPYWADGILAAFDRAVLGGDAWRLVPAMFVRPLDALYPFWAVVKFLALVAVLALPASRLKSQAMLSYFLTVGVIGVTGQYLLSSGGPIFYDRLMNANQFGELAQRTEALAPIAHTASEYLWSNYLTRDTAIGAGISAMPSMHVATTTWTAIALSRFWPKLGIPIWLFWLIIFAGSVALGWHYVSDSVVGAGGAFLCWYITPKILEKLAHWRNGEAGRATLAL